MKYQKTDEIPVSTKFLLFIRVPSMYQNHKDIEVQRRQISRRTENLEGLPEYHDFTKNHILYILEYQDGPETGLEPGTERNKDLEGSLFFQ